MPAQTLEPYHRRAQVMKGQIGVAWIARISRWYQLSRERACLRQISDAALKDLGLSRADIEAESHRAFWDDPFNR